MIFNSIYPYFIFFSIAMGTSIGIISAYMVTKKWSILGDIISHAALPGIVGMFFFSYSVFLPFLIIGGTISSLISVISSFYLQKHESFPRDTSFSLLLSWFFSIGIILFNIIQRKGIIGQSILNSFIFGNILMIDYKDVYYYAVYSVILVLIFFYTRKKQEFFTFDAVFSKIRYKYVFIWEIIFLVISIFTITLALQSIGILLIGGLIILPGSTALLLSKNYTQLLFWSIFFSILIFLLGINITFYLPTLPTGPLCMLSAGAIFFIILFFKKYIQRR